MHCKWEKEYAAWTLNDEKKQVLVSETILFVFNGTMRVVLTGNFGKEMQEKRKSNLSQNTILKHVESISLIYATLLDNRKSGIYIMTSLISQLFQIVMINNHNNNNKKQTKGTKLKRNFRTICRELLRLFSWAAFLMSVFFLRVPWVFQFILSNIIVFVDDTENFS